MSVEFWLLIGLIGAVLAGLSVVTYYIVDTREKVRESVIVGVNQIRADIKRALGALMKAHDEGYLKLYDELDSIKIILDGVEMRVQDALDPKYTGRYIEPYSFEIQDMINPSDSDYELVYEKITSLDEANKKENEDETN